MQVTSILYRVTITEYDYGAQRVDPSDTKVFTTEAEAKAYADWWENGSTHDCYWRAHIERI
jgi:hypothetical protein